MIGCLVHRGINLSYVRFNIYLETLRGHGWPLVPVFCPAFPARGALCPTLPPPHRTVGQKPVKAAKTLGMLRPPRVVK